MDKEQFYKLCDKYGIDHPETFIYDASIGHDFELPWKGPYVAKPANGVSYWATGCTTLKKAYICDTWEELLAANERRRAPETVAVALEVALAACSDAGRDPKRLPSVFASTHGDLAITDYMAETLAADPRAISPTRFHNSVHNAAAGYWTIGAGCMAAATAISAGTASFTIHFLTLPVPISFLPVSAMRIPPKSVFHIIA